MKEKLICVIQMGRKAKVNSNPQAEIDQIEDKGHEIVIKLELPSNDLPHHLIEVQTTIQAPCECVNVKNHC